MSDAPSAALGAVRVRGSEAIPFLQGQLSQNIEHVTAQRSLTAGLHNAQGRVIAIARLVHLAADDLLAVLPRELAQLVVARLAKFVLRAKVSVKDESNAWSIERLIGGPGDRDPSAPWERNAQQSVDGSRLVCVGENPSRWLRVAPQASASRAEESPAHVQAWERCEIAGGEPQVYAVTSEAFVSQMLNLDALGAIAFDKGCYTGQEIIARAHYRGRMKRRMQRFAASDGPALAPGARGHLPDGRSFTVVRAVASVAGVDFLAVTSLPDARGAAADRASAATDEGTLVRAVQQPLPYALPQ